MVIIFKKLFGTYKKSPRCPYFILLSDKDDDYQYESNDEE